jgi:polysaccharide export outer membrane protein
MSKLCVAFLLALASPAFAQTPSPDKSVDYVVGAQDVLKVIVFDEPQLSGTFRVDTDGTITYPFLGRIKAVGETLRAIETELIRRLADGYVKRPQVSIEVEHYRSRNIQIVGEVRSPGKYPLTGSMTLLEAIAQAGSTTPNASSEILILHAASGGREGEGTVAPGVPGVAQTTRVSLTDLHAGKLASNIVLREGDTILVPKAEKFYVTGHVRTPGAYTYDRGMTVLQAISLAGGLSERGSSRGIKVIRLVDGTRKEVGVKLEDVIQPNDTLVVRQRLL